MPSEMMTFPKDLMDIESMFVRVIGFLSIFRNPTAMYALPNAQWFLRWRCLNNFSQPPDIDENRKTPSIQGLGLHKCPAFSFIDKVGSDNCHFSTNYDWSELHPKIMPEVSSIYYTFFSSCFTPKSHCRCLESFFNYPGFAAGPETLVDS